MEFINEAHGAALTAEDIAGLIRKAVREVNRQLPAYKHISDIHIRETEFIKTTTKKIKRYLEKPV
jgi:long-chain acyl-CoA synthetase